MRKKDLEITDIAKIIHIIKKCDVCRLGISDAGISLYDPLKFRL